MDMITLAIVIVGGYFVLKSGILKGGMGGGGGGTPTPTPPPDTGGGDGGEGGEEYEEGGGEYGGKGGSKGGKSKGGKGGKGGKDGRDGYGDRDTDKEYGADKGGYGKNVHVCTCKNGRCTGDCPGYGMMMGGYNSTIICPPRRYGARTRYGYPVYQTMNPSYGYDSVNRYKRGRYGNMGGVYDGCVDIYDLMARRYPYSPYKTRWGYY